MSRINQDKSGQALGILLLVLMLILAWSYIWHRYTFDTLVEQKNKLQIEKNLLMEMKKCQ